MDCTFFFNLFIFLFGLAVGSFLNSVIYRLQTGVPHQLFFKSGGGFERSYCPRCQHTLNWQDLIPVLSFLILKGRCRYCQKPISLQYPLVELLTGLIFLSIFNFQFPIFNEFSIFNFLKLIYYWTISAFLIVIFVYDLKHYIIPDKIIYPAIAIAVLYHLFEILNFSHWNLIRNWKLEIGNLQPLINPLSSAFLASLFFLLIVLISRGKWMGVGDIKLAFLMGLFLGWPNILVALFSAFFIGAIIGIGLIISGKKTLKSEIPFGPFLVTATFLAIFFGQQIINWYSTLFLLQ